MQNKTITKLKIPMLNEFDLTDPKMNDLYKECSSIAYDLNHYKVQFEKDKQQDL